ncbi:hypothetical protein ACI1TR_05040 [Lactococcus garvieae]|uniref:hypothetical protein n=1 Tax=Lactococcus garvieae TaxID=1363 RepID=UPI00385563B8
MNINERIENLLRGISTRIDVILNKTNMMEKPAKIWKLNDGYGNKLVFYFLGTILSVLISIFIISPYSTQLSYLNTARASNINYTISNTSVFQPGYKSKQMHLFVEKEDFVNSSSTKYTDLNFTFDVIIKSGAINHAYLIYSHQQKDKDYIFKEKDFHAINSIQTKSTTDLLWFLNQEENKSISISNVNADINYTENTSNQIMSNKFVYLALIDQNNNINISLLTISNVSPQIFLEKGKNDKFNVNRVIPESDLTIPKYQFLTRTQILENQDVYNQFKDDKKLPVDPSIYLKNTQHITDILKNYYPNS